MKQKVIYWRRNDYSVTDRSYYLVNFLNKQIDDGYLIQSCQIMDKDSLISEPKVALLFLIKNDENAKISLNISG